MSISLQTQIQIQNLKSYNLYTLLYVPYIYCSYFITVSQLPEPGIAHSTSTHFSILHFILANLHFLTYVHT